MNTYRVRLRFDEIPLELKACYITSEGPMIKGFQQMPAKGEADELVWIVVNPISVEKLASGPTATAFKATA